MVLMNKKQYIGIIILAVMILGFLFYWYEFRPYQVKRTCVEETSEALKGIYGDEKVEIKEWKERFDFLYKCCLRKKGF